MLEHHINNYMNYEIPGWMSKRDLEILTYLSSCVPENGNILEIGPFLGRSTAALLEGKKDSVSLDAVDTFTGIDLNKDYPDIKGSKDLFYEMRTLANATGDWEQSFRFCQSDNIDKINLFKCSSKDFELIKPYNFSFIDASHTLDAATFDIKKYFNLKGLIAGDDFVPWWPGVVEAVNTFRNNNYATLVVPRGSKIWILVPINKYWEKCVREII